MEKWQQSGLPGTEFARRHALGQGSLYRWTRFVEAQPETSSGLHMGFAEVRVRATEVPTSGGSIELVARSARVVRIVGQVDAEQLRTVLEVLDPC